MDKLLHLLAKLLAAQTTTAIFDGRSDIAKELGLVEFMVTEQEAYEILREYVNMPITVQEIFPEKKEPFDKLRG